MTKFADLPVGARFRWYWWVAGPCEKVNERYARVKLSTGDYHPFPIDPEEPVEVVEESPE